MFSQVKQSGVETDSKAFGWTD